MVLTIENIMHEKLIKQNGLTLKRQNKHSAIKLPYKFKIF